MYVEEIMGEKSKIWEGIIAIQARVNGYLDSPELMEVITNEWVQHIF